MKHILNPEFQYTPSYATDIRRTFAQRRAQLEFERSAHACQSCRAGYCIKDRDAELLPLDLNHEPADKAEAIEMLRRARARGVIQ